MSATTLNTARLEFSPLMIAIAGAMSLSVAMGIGRFAFTPLLPMMLHDGVIDIGGGSVLATANYAGYLIGALICMALPMLLRQFGLNLSNGTMVRFGLAATTMLTAAMMVDLPSTWATLRFLSGVISAVVFVYMSGWCLKRLADMNALSLSGIIYIGPGVGITLSGATAFGVSSTGGTAAVGWLAFAILAAIISAIVWPVFRPDALTNRPVSDSPANPAATVRQPWTAESVLLAIAYGLAGFGYIITATFLPVIARTALGNSGWIELFWPVFGIAVAIGALSTRIIPLSIDRRALLIGCYLIQALGILATLLMPTVAGFLIGSALVGLPFTVISLCAMQEARRLRPADTTSFMGLMTAIYGAGQIAGPPLAAAILADNTSQSTGFSVSLTVATATLLLGAALYAVSMLFYRARQ